MLGRNMKKILLCLVFVTFTLQAQAALSLDVKIARKIGAKIVETTKKIAANYNQDVVISEEGFKNKIILKLKKFSNIKVNGNAINPVQIDLRMIDATERLVGKPQTITSFYQQSAQFKLPSDGVITDPSDLQVSLNFQEMN